MANFLLVDLILFVFSVLTLGQEYEENPEIVSPTAVEVVPDLERDWVTEDYLSLIGNITGQLHVGPYAGQFRVMDGKNRAFVVTGAHTAVAVRFCDEEAGTCKGKAIMDGATGSVYSMNIPNVFEESTTKKFLNRMAAWLIDVSVDDLGQRDENGDPILFDKKALVVTNDAVALLTSIGVKNVTQVKNPWSVQFEEYDIVQGMLEGVRCGSNVVCGGEDGLDVRLINFLKRGGRFVTSFKSWSHIGGQSDLSLEVFIRVFGPAGIFLEDTGYPGTYTSAYDRIRSFQEVLNGNYATIVDLLLQHFDPNDDRNLDSGSLSSAMNAMAVWARMLSNSKDVAASSSAVSLINEVLDAACVSRVETIGTLWPSSGNTVKPSGTYVRDQVSCMKILWPLLKANIYTLGKNVDDIKNTLLQFPGTVDESLYGEQTITISPTRIGGGFISTGLWLPPMEKVHITVSKELAQNRPSLRIGVHSDSLYEVPIRQDDKADLTRSPELVKSEAIIGEESDVWTFAGGILWIVFGRNLPTVDVTITVSKAALYPLFDSTTSMSQEAWEAMVVDHPAPFLELASKYFGASVRYDNAKNSLAETRAAAEYWDMFVQYVFSIKAANIPSNLQRVVQDQQISIGALHSGNPIMSGSYPGIFAPFVGSKWGMAHEIGHNEASGAIMPGYWGETSNNLFSEYITLVSNTVDGRTESAANAAKEINLRWNQTNSAFHDWVNNQEPFFGLRFHMRLINTFGWELMRRMYGLQSLIPSQYTTGDVNDRKLAYFMDLACRSTGYNMLPWFESWGINVLSAAQTTFNMLPAWGGSPWEVPEGEKYDVWRKSLPLFEPVRVGAYPVVGPDQVDSGLFTLKFKTEITTEALQQVIDALNTLTLNELAQRLVIECDSETDKTFKFYIIPNSLQPVDSASPMFLSFKIQQVSKTSLTNIADIIDLDILGKFDRITLTRSMGIYYYDIPKTETCSNFNDGWFFNFFNGNQESAELQMANVSTFAALVENNAEPPVTEFHLAIGAFEQQVSSSESEYMFKWNGQELDNTLMEIVETKFANRRNLVLHFDPKNGLLGSGESGEGSTKSKTIKGDYVFGIVDGDSVKGQTEQSLNMGYHEDGYYAWTIDRYECQTTPALMVFMKLYSLKREQNGLGNLPTKCSELTMLDTAADGMTCWLVTPVWRDLDNPLLKRETDIPEYVEIVWIVDSVLGRMTSEGKSVAWDLFLPTFRVGGNTKTDIEAYAASECVIPESVLNNKYLFHFSSKKFAGSQGTFADVRIQIGYMTENDVFAFGKPVAYAFSESTKFEMACDSNNPEQYVTIPNEDITCKMFSSYYSCELYIGDEERICTLRVNNVNPFAHIEPATTTIYQYIARIDRIYEEMNHNDTDPMVVNGNPFRFGLYVMDVIEKTFMNPEDFKIDPALSWYWRCPDDTSRNLFADAGKSGASVDCLKKSQFYACTFKLPPSAVGRCNVGVTSSHFDEQARFVNASISLRFDKTMYKVTTDESFDFSIEWSPSRPTTLSENKDGFKLSLDCFGDTEDHPEQYSLSCKKQNSVQTKCTGVVNRIGTCFINATLDPNVHNPEKSMFVSVERPSIIARPKPVSSDGSLDSATTEPIPIGGVTIDDILDECGLSNSLDAYAQNFVTACDPKLNKVWYMRKRDPTDRTQYDFIPYALHDLVPVSEDEPEHQLSSFGESLGYFNLLIMVLNGGDMRAHMFISQGKVGENVRYVTFIEIDMQAFDPTPKPKTEKLDAPELMASLRLTESQVNPGQYDAVIMKPGTSRAALVTVNGITEKASEADVKKEFEVLVTEEDDSETGFASKAVYMDSLRRFIVLGDRAFEEGKGGFRIQIQEDGHWVAVSSQGITLAAPENVEVKGMGAAIVGVGDYIAISAPGDSETLGHVFIYHWDNATNTMNLVHQINSSENEIDDMFGSSLSMYALSESVFGLAIGAPDASVDNLVSAGKVIYLRFSQDETDSNKITIVSETEFTHITPGENDRFGKTVSMTKNMLTVGVPGRLGGGETFLVELGLDPIVEPKKEKNLGLLIGLPIAIVVVLALILGLVFGLRARKQKQQKAQKPKADAKTSPSEVEVKVMKVDDSVPDNQSSSSASHSSSASSTDGKQSGASNAESTSGASGSSLEERAIEEQ